MAAHRSSDRFSPEAQARASAVVVRYGVALATVAASLVSLAVFAATGLVIAWLNHRLQRAEEAQRTAAHGRDGSTPSST